MKRQTARRIHLATNAMYWMERPDWFTGNSVLDTGLRMVRGLPFSVHGALKKTFFHTENLLAVNGESVVVARGEMVDKFMFRYPRVLNLDQFRQNVEHEVGVVVAALGGIALPTQVSIRSADILRSRRPVRAVTQTQTRLDLNTHVPFYPEMLKTSSSSVRNNKLLDTTARTMASLLQGIEVLVGRGYYPDIGPGSDNLRYNTENGGLCLVDVMPVYTNGSRLIGDRPLHIVPAIKESIAAYQEFVGRYGS